MFFLILGKRPIKEIKAPELLTVLRRVESRGTLEVSSPYQGLFAAKFLDMQLQPDGLNVIRQPICAAHCRQCKTINTGGYYRT